MLEWLKRHAWKACIPQKGISGSNPDLSAIYLFDMKKVLFTLLIAAGLFTFAGCAKNCHCTATSNGKVIFEQTYEIEDGEECANYLNSITVPVIDYNYESKCESELF